MLKPTPVAITPIRNIYKHAFTLPIPRIIAFVKPRLRSSIDAIPRTIGQRDAYRGYA